jgi:hypothetical protein
MLRDQRVIEVYLGAASGGPAEERT